MASPLSIALIEDHDRLREAMANLLRSHAHHVFELDAVEDIDTVIGGALVHLFILDLNLPGEDGLAFARRLREIQPDVGIIMMTARGSSQHIAQGYEAGADVYFVKPVSPEMLLGAIASIQRRLPHNPERQKGAFRLDMSSLRLTGPQGTVELNQAEAALLAGLMRSPQRTLEIDQISRVMGQPPNGLNKASLEVRVVRLRKKLVTVGAESGAIKPQRLQGYQLCVSIEIR
jgi:DNA-binding response OmpR family regulator